MLKKYYRIIERIFYLLISNPRFFFKRIFLEFKLLFLPVPASHISKKINGVLFDFDFNYSDRIKKMYFGAYEPIIVEIFKKYLKNGDTFIDVGASIGYLTAIAAGLVGKNGQVHSFEPVKGYFQKLDTLAKNNKEYKIITNQFALGDEEKSSKIHIRGVPDIGHNTFFPILLENAKNEIEEVVVRRLDRYIEEKGISNIKLIKIDVEGFELFVLRGLSRYFSKCSLAGFCPGIICEIVPTIYSHLGYRLEGLFDYMGKFSYYPFEIINQTKRIDINKIIKNGQDVDVFFKYIKI
jgi:FkbM family methyltransferase